MSKLTTKQLFDSPEAAQRMCMAIVQALLEGKRVIQEAKSGHFKGETYMIHCFDFNNNHYWVEEPTRKVPFGPRDIKPGMEFRSRGEHPSIRRPYAYVDSGGLDISGLGYTPFIVLRGSYLYTTDAGVTWHNCEKEEE